MDFTARKKVVLGAGLAAALAVTGALTLPGLASSPHGAAAPVASSSAPATTPPPGRGGLGASPSPSRQPAPKDTGEFTPAYYRKWSDGLPADPRFFPIAVWMQDPNRERGGKPNALNYKNAGINTFAGLWEFPTRDDSAARLATVHKYGMYALAGGEDGSTSGASKAVDLSAAGALGGFLLGDEQDMSTNPKHITPEEVAAWAKAVAKAEPSRPVYNNWGKAFSLYPWIGGHDDKPGLSRYCANVDINSSDYYAATDGWEPKDKHTPNYYGKAVTNVRTLCGGRKPAWGFIETGHPGGDSGAHWPPYTTAKGTIAPSAVEQGVWSMLAHGANGIVYFVHDFRGDGFTEDGLFDHPATVTAITRVNRQIQALAPILNAQRQPKGLTVHNADATLRADAGGWYVIAAGTSAGKRGATFTVAQAANRSVEVVGENRTIKANAKGTWSDSFGAWGHHVYKIAS